MAAAGGDIQPPPGKRCRSPPPLVGPPLDAEEEGLGGEVVGGKPAAAMRRVMRGAEDMQRACRELVRAVGPGALPPGIAGWASAPAMAPPKLLVLDLNGILVYRHCVHHGGAMAAHAQRPPDAVVGSFRIWLRPHAREFLQWCLQRFAVGIWSSAMQKNVESLLPVLGLVPDHLAFVWGADRCTDVGPDDACPGKRRVCKDLSVLWNVKFAEPVGSEEPPRYGAAACPPELPALPSWTDRKPRPPIFGLYGPSTTLLVDDDWRKAALNPPFTSVHPTPFTDAHLSGSCPDALLAPSGGFSSFLQELSDCPDVRACVHRHARQADAAPWLPASPAAPAAAAAAVSPPPAS